MLNAHQSPAEYDREAPLLTAFHTTRTLGRRMDLIVLPCQVKKPSEN
ncbi:MAG: hypothetical protein MI975_07405 [Cytophagales bacterium]|nr:hypothetical protein [Cytophagales bacterium]